MIDCFIYGLLYWLIDYVIGWLIVILFDCFIALLIDWFFWLIDCFLILGRRIWVGCCCLRRSEPASSGWAWGGRAAGALQLQGQAPQHNPGLQHQQGDEERLTDEKCRTGRQAWFDHGQV